MNLGRWGHNSDCNKGIFSATDLVIKSSNSRGSQIYSIHFHRFFFFQVSVLSGHRILLGLSSNFS